MVPLTLGMLVDVNHSLDSNVCELRARMRIVAPVSELRLLGTLDHAQNPAAE